MITCLFRNVNNESQSELEICKKYFKVISNPGELFNSMKEHYTLLCRYSALPFYKEVSDTINEAGYKMLNSYEQHLFIANFRYYDIIKKYTPETYFEYVDIPDKGPFIVKGVTNSRKFNWNTLMYAETKKDAIDIACDLDSDSLLSSQKKIVRKYYPLETFEIGINGLRFTNEWRVFCLGKEILCLGYYWSNAKDAESINGNIIWRQEARDFAAKIVPLISEFTNFYALDVAKTESGQWILIEINDGQMSGLSMNDPNELYCGLYYEMGTKTY